MSLIAQAVTLISEPPGSFVYHVLILFALEASLAMSLGEHRRLLHPGTKRLVVAAGLGLAARLLIVVIAALGSVGLVNDDVALPPIDRAVSLATFLLIAWAIIGRQGKHITDGVLCGILILLFMAAIVSILLWQPSAIQGVAYNDTLDDKLWHTAQIGVLTVLISLVAWQRPAQWGMTIGLFTLPALASIAHLYQSVTSPVLSGHVAAFNRVAELAALPMFAMIVYQRIVLNLLRRSSGYDGTMPLRLAEFQDTGDPGRPVAALQERLARLQQEWDDLETRVGELGDAPPEDHTATGALGE